MQKEASKVILPATVRRLLWLLNFMTAKSTSSSFRSALAIALCSQSTGTSGPPKISRLAFQKLSKTTFCARRPRKATRKTQLRVPLHAGQALEFFKLLSLRKAATVLSLMLRAPKPSCEGFGAERSQVHLPVVLSISISDDFVSSRSV